MSMKDRNSLSLEDKIVVKETTLTTTNANQHNIVLPDDDGTIALTKNLPPVNNAKITIHQERVPVDQTFTLNQTADCTINLNDTWQPNTETQAGYVDAGGADHKDQVWGTNNNGVPQWISVAQITGDYVPLVGTTTAKPMTGSIWFQDIDGIKVRSNEKDIKIWEVINDDGYNEQWGFYEQYHGTGAGIYNSLKLFAGNSSTDHTKYVEVREITQDGATHWKQQLNIEGGMSLNNSVTVNKDMPYFLGIDAIDNGGKVHWVSKADTKVGYATQATELFQPHPGYETAPITKSEYNNELNIYYSGPTWLNYRGGSSKILIGNGTGANECGDIEANSFIKTGGTNKNVLLDGGLVKPLSEFAGGADLSDYLAKTGGTMSGTINYGVSGTNKVAINFRDNFDVSDANPTGRYNCGFFYDTSGYETLSLAMQQPLQRFGIISDLNLNDIEYGSSIGRTFGLVVINNKVGINAQYADGAQPAAELEVNGTTKATKYRVSDKVTMQYDSSEGCLEFVFN